MNHITGEAHDYINDDFSKPMMGFFKGWEGSLEVPGISDSVISNHTHALTEPECIVLIAMHKYAMHLEDNKTESVTWARILYAIRRLCAQEAGKSLWNFANPLKKDV